MNIDDSFNRAKIIENINNIDRHIKINKGKIKLIETNILNNSYLCKINSIKNGIKKFNMSLVKNDYAGSLSNRIIKFIFSIFILEFVNRLFLPIYPLSFSLNHAVYLIPFFLYKEVIIILNIVFRFLPICLFEKISIKINKIKKKKVTKKYYNLLNELEYNRSTFLNLLRQCDNNNSNIDNNNINVVTFEEKILSIEEQILNLNDNVKVSLLFRLRNIINDNQRLKNNSSNSWYLNYITYCELVKLELDVIKIAGFSKKGFVIDKKKKLCKVKNYK